MRDPRHRSRNVSTAEKIQHRLRENGLDENLEGASANETRIVAGLLIQVENHLARRFLFDHFLRRRPHIRFDTSAADRSGDRTVFANQHSRTLKAGNRSVGVHDGG